jgi:TolB-like protein
MNIDGSEQSEVFSHGLAEDVLDRLARVPGLLVSARGDSWSLPVNSRSADVRKRLRVAYYLEGSVRIVGDHLRVVAQLIDSERGVHVVSRSFDKKIENFLEVQREITELTVANLRVVLPEETQMLFANEYEGLEVDAYIMYRRGRAGVDAGPGLCSSACRAVFGLYNPLHLDEQSTDYRGCGARVRRRHGSQQQSSHGVYGNGRSVFADRQPS